MKQTELLSKALDKIGSYFLLCNLLSMRVKQLEEGIQPKVEGQDRSNVEIALEEIIRGKVEFLRSEDKLSS